MRDRHRFHVALAAAALGAACGGPPKAVPVEADAGTTAPADGAPAGPSTRGRAVEIPPPPLPPLPVPVRFADVTAAAGLDERQWNPPPAYADAACGQIEIMTGGAAAADIDGDGWVDLFVPRLDARDLLYRNAGDGTFDEIGSLAGVADDAASNGAAWGDIDGDGDLDLVVTRIRGGGAVVYVNDGAGRFTDETDRLTWSPPADTCSAMFSPSFGDPDRDGDLDLYLAQWHRDITGAWRSYYFRNGGDGHFYDATASAGLLDADQPAFTASFADVDDDGWPDLLIAADFGRSELYRNLGGATFARVTAAAGVGTDENGMGAAVGDLDNDGDLDWFVTSVRDTRLPCPTGWGCSGNRLYLNAGDGTFSDATDDYRVRDGRWGWGAAMFDVDLDGDLDIGMATGMRMPWDTEFNAWAAPFLNDPLRLWLNDGADAPMREVADTARLSDTGSGKAFVPLDYDNDGDLDVFVTNNAGTPRLFRNDLLDERSWLAVQLSGRPPNTQAVGATVFVQLTPSAGVQRRDVNANSTFLGMGPAEARFGLGEPCDAVHRAWVVWPDDGSITSFDGVACDQVVTVEQPGIE